MGIMEYLSEMYPEVMIMDGFDDCIIGIAERACMEIVVAYDRNKVINKLMGMGMDEDSAIEYFYYNQLGSYIGKHTPVFVEVFDEGMCG